MMLARICKISPGTQFLAEPTPFIPLLSKTLPSGANKTMKKIRTEVFKCRPGESFIPSLLRPLHCLSNVRSRRLKPCALGSRWIAVVHPGVKKLATESTFHESFEIDLTRCFSQTKAPGSEIVRFLLCFFDRRSRLERALVSTQRRGTFLVREVQRFRKPPITYFLPSLPHPLSITCWFCIARGVFFGARRPACRGIPTFCRRSAI